MQTSKLYTHLYKLFIVCIIFLGLNIDLHINSIYNPCSSTPETYNDVVECYCFSSENDGSNCISYNISGNETQITIPQNKTEGVIISRGDSTKTSRGENSEIYSYGDKVNSEKLRKNVSELTGICNSFTGIDKISYLKCEKTYDDSINSHEVTIMNPKNIETLNLENAHITEITNSFGLRNLKNLFMKKNGLTSANFTDIRDLEKIDLSFNNLREFIIFDGTAENLDLSYNLFSEIPSHIRTYRNYLTIILDNDTILTGTSTENTIDLTGNPINFIEITDPDIYGEHNYNGSITYKRKAYSHNGYSPKFGYTLTGAKQSGNLKINESYEKDGQLIITGTTSDTEITFNNLFSGHGVGGLNFSVYYIDNPSISGQRYNETRDYGGEMEILSPDNNENLTSNTVSFARNRTGYLPTYQFYYTLSGNNNYFTSGYTNNTGISIDNLPIGNYTFKVGAYYGSYTYSTKYINFSITKQPETTHTLTINYINSEGGTTIETKTYHITGGSYYSYESPTITGYTADYPVVTGTMPNQDKTITVTYTKNSSGGGGGGGGGGTSSTTNTYTLTIYYRYNDGSTAKSTYTENFKEGDRYSISSPNISNYTANYTVVEGTMPSSNKTVTVTYTKNSSNYLSVNTNNRYPSIDEWIKLSIETDSDYTDRINFSKLQYRSSTSSSWSNISRTSNAYISDYSDDWSAGYYRMNRSDYGYVTLNNLVKFNRGGYYRIYVTDTYGNESYTEIEVEDDLEYNDGNHESNLTLSTNNYNPDKYETINVTLKTDNYIGKIKLYAKYKDSSDSRIKISNNSSNEYFSDFSYIWENGYYKMTSSDKGKKTLYDLIGFKKDGAYRIYAEDEKGYANYFTINVNGSTTNNQTKVSEDSGDDIDKLINQLLGSNTTNNDQSYDEIERNKNNLSNVSDEIYKSRSCKEYKIQYNPTLGVYTSPNLQKAEYFINKEYFKRYIDSKNPQKEGCPTNIGWISTNYKDTSSSNEYYIAPNGKVYFFSRENGIYKSNGLAKDKQFQSLNEIKYYIRDRNPLIGM